jgi:glyoxylase-like metal-dependent hydrolase (beta-lactamase superfamily II)
MRNVDIEAAHAILVAAFRPARRTSINTFIVHSHGRIALIDTGCGNKMANTGGRLLNNLAALSVEPSEIETVLLTHLHPDHVGGLTDGGGAAVFTAAEIALHTSEWRYWNDASERAKVDESTRKFFFKPAQDALAPYKAQLKPFTGGEVFPGVTAIPSPGHTPGHTAFLVSSQSEQLMIWGDTVHVPEVQTAFPEAGMSFDSDLAQAAASRRRIFEQVASERLLVAGMHTHFPAFGHLIREGQGFRYVAEAWVHNL